MKLISSKKFSQNFHLPVEQVKDKVYYSTARSVFSA